MNRLLNNPGDVTRELRHVGPRQRAAFAAACAERLYPAYARFRGQSEPRLRAILDRVWELAETDGAELPELDRLSEEVETLAPDTSNPASPFTPLSQFVSGALDTAIAVGAAIECLRSDDPDCCRDAAEAGTNTVYQALSEPYLRSGDHPLLWRELEWQREDIASVKSSGLSSDLRARAKKRGQELLRDLERLLIDG
jgi:hypothetical protein